MAQVNEVLFKILCHNVCVSHPVRLRAGRLTDFWNRTVGCFKSRLNHGIMEQGPGSTLKSEEYHIIA